MPTYEYECAKCKKTFEFFQSMKDAPLKTCTKETCCMNKWGKGKVRRLIGTGAGLIFKGSGFYQTDYRSEGYKKSAQSETSKSETPAATTTTSAPAEKKTETSTTKKEKP